MAKELVLEETSAGGDGFTGYGAGFTKDEPAAGTTTLITNDYASLSAAAAAGQRVKISGGLIFSQTADLDLALYAQVYSPAGRWTLDGWGHTGNVNHIIPSADGFIGNMRLKLGVGKHPDDNNPASGFGFEDFAVTTGFYIFYCDMLPDPQIAVNKSAGTDGPESISIWNGSTKGDFVRLITYHGPQIIDYIVGTKSMTSSAGGTNTTSNSKITFWRWSSLAWTRSPNMKDGISVDIANCVQPVYSGTQSIGINSKNGQTPNLVDVRGSLIRGNSTSSGNLVAESNTEMYYDPVTSGATGDESLEVSNPDTTLAGSNPYGSSRLGAYTHKPTCQNMTTALGAAIAAERSGDYAIFEGVPGPEDPDPLSFAHAAWNTLATLGGPIVKIVLPNHEKHEPYERRWLDAVPGSEFLRFNHAAKAFVRDQSYRYPGLDPYAERSRLWLPSRTIFAVGGA